MKPSSSTQYLPRRLVCLAGLSAAVAGAFVTLGYQADAQRALRLLPSRSADEVARTRTLELASSLTVRSDLIARGVVQHIEVRPKGPDGQPGLHTLVVLQISELLKSNPSANGSTVAFWVHGGRQGDRVRHISGQTTFQVGEDVAVFLAKRSAALWPTGMALGKWTIVEPTPAREMVRPPFEHQALEPLSLDELRRAMGTGGTQ